MNMATAVRKTFHFVIALADAQEITDAMENAVLAAGCDDALLWSRGGAVYLTCRREADSLGAAIGSAIDDVGRAGLKVARVDVDAPAE
jgi:hypothetical protein